MGICSFKKCFSGKASAWYKFNKDHGIIALMPNGFGIHKSEDKQIEIVAINLQIPEPKIKLLDRKLIQGKHPLQRQKLLCLQDGV